MPSIQDFVIMDNGIPVVTPLVSPAQMKFHENSNYNLILQNMFRENAARRYRQRSPQTFNKIIKFSPTYMAPIASTKLNTTTLICLIGWTSFGIGVISFTILAALYLFQRAEKKRYRYQNDEILINGNDYIPDEF